MKVAHYRLGFTTLTDEIDLPNFPAAGGCPSG